MVCDVIFEKLDFFSHVVVFYYQDFTEQTEFIKFMHIKTKVYTYNMYNEMLVKFMENYI